MPGHDWAATARETPWLSSLSRAADDANMERRRSSVSPEAAAETGRSAMYFAARPHHHLAEQAAYANLTAAEPQYAAPTAPAAAGRGQLWSSAVTNGAAQLLKRRKADITAGAGGNGIQGSAIAETALGNPNTYSEASAALGSREGSLGGAFQPQYVEPSAEVGVGHGPFSCPGMPVCEFACLCVGADCIGVQSAACAGHCVPWLAGGKWRGGGTR